jgi:CHAT domain-containing protein
LVLFLDTPARKVAPEETFIWVVTKTDARWVRSDLGTAGLNRGVRALRCGLDAEEWATPTRATHCGDLLGRLEAQDPPRSLPFDLDKAHVLYRALFGQVEDLIKGKHLLIVPSGPLTQLPFQVLVTAAPAKGGYKSTAWLARSHALTVLPAVSSLKALRRVARPSAAAMPMIGFGNPLLDGPDSRYAKSAQRARDNQRCRDSRPPHVPAGIGARGMAPLELGSGLAKVSDIRIQAPLPETADELCAVARDLQANIKEVYLGARATEHEVKALSDRGQLADYRVVHFATHGAMAGQLRGTAEPGLLLTPPAEASADDDGYLSASEIAGLKLDADWVILSACNTAAGDADGAQALSGLARAFFYAQARALLVSHWAVNSDATVKLITWAMREVSQDGRIGRAEALRRAMLALVDQGEPHESHPAYWAPFIVVGEGAL